MWQNPFWENYDKLCFYCVDINECLEGLFTDCHGPFDKDCSRVRACAPNADCSNRIGGHNCVCKDGYEGSPFALDGCEGEQPLSDLFYCIAYLSRALGEWGLTEMVMSHVLVTYISCCPKSDLNWRISNVKKSVSFWVWIVLSNGIQALICILVLFLIHLSRLNH